MAMATKNLMRWLEDCGVADLQALLGRQEECSGTVTRPLAGTRSGEKEPVESRGLVRDLEQLEREVHQFTGCPLRTGQQRTVFARGNVDSGLMIIGEAPGANEDKEGIPFCGVSGKLLDQILCAIAMSDAYITNMVFWRPENNRKPSAAEVASCLDLVQQHIALVRPKVLLLLGSTAANGLLDPTTSMTQMRNAMRHNPFQYSNPYLSDPVLTLVSYHPSYLLRQPLRKRDAWQDFLLVRKMIFN
jgi:uracil-DNA glycosylase family 4